ncbi:MULTISPECIES: helix-turn-helix domain-containing protein [Microbacterium]|uniref:helix-turn-helix domain-containing protein n=1 Tax=Microbacterium sp. 77mftsu3.1 TaxID=1761802 RepID=UPI000882B49E|nr:Helix-turn-helix [Microbacterium sp. 77mftsu3.1]
MTAIDRKRTVLDVENATPASAQELSAARAEIRAEILLGEAFRVSGKSQRQLADDLGVTEGRVSQILSGGASLKVSTLARYLRALGFQLEVAAEPLEKGLDRLPRPKRARGRVGSSLILHSRRAEGTNGPSQQIMFALERADGSEGWKPVGEVRELRGHLTSLSSNGSSSSGSSELRLTTSEER